MKEALAGFDSAWSAKNKGAIAYAVFQEGVLESEAMPQLSSFAEASEIIKRLQDECDDVLVAIDQPTIVPNQNSCRPVDRVAGSLVSKLKGGTQPANRSKAMFNDAAPIWGFATAISHSKYLGKGDEGTTNPLVDFEAAKFATGRTRLIEVYPALALPALDPVFMARKVAPKYNPANKGKFSLSDWQGVCQNVRRCANESGLQQLSEWADKAAALSVPQKHNQDGIDAVICLLIALWVRREWEKRGLTTIGDLKSGYMVTPTSDATRQILQEAAHKRGVPICS